MVGDWRELVTSPTATFLIALGSACGAGFLFLDIRDAVFGTFLAAAVLFVAAADLDRFEIPDTGSFAILICGFGWILETWGFDGEALEQAVVRCCVAAGLLLAVRTLYRSVRGFDGLGLGDVKLAGAGASWLSWSHIVVALLLAVSAAIGVAIARSIYTRKRIEANTVVPFGAFLAPAIWIAWFGQMNGL